MMVCQSGRFGASGPANPYGFVSGSASVTTVDVANSGTLSLPYVSGIGYGDILIAHFVGARSSSNAWTVTAPLGWTQLVNQIIGSTTFRHWVFWRRADGTETGNADFAFNFGSTTSTLAAAMSSWGGCIISGSPFVNLGTNSPAGASVSAVGTAVTTTAANQIVVNLVSVSDDGATSTPPSGYTETYDFSQNLTIDTTLSLNYKVIPTISTEGPTTTVLATSDIYAVSSFGLLAN